MQIHKYIASKCIKESGDTEGWVARQWDKLTLVSIEMVFKSRK